MINGLEGIPGSGKSYEAVVFHVLASLKAGRKVITNLPLVVDFFAAIDPAYRDLIEIRTRPRPVMGTWDANRVDDKGQGSAFEPWPDGVPPPSPAPRLVTSPGSQTVRAVVPREPVVFGQVWEFYDTWRHPDDGRGPIFIIDECHVCFPEYGTDPQVVEWFKLHRHFNVDVLLMTQSFRDINQPMARLVAMLIKVRNADVLGKGNAYIRKVHAGYRGPLLSSDERKYQSQYFPLYKSHTQGNSITESAALDVKPFIVYFNRFKWGFIAFTVLVMAYVFWPSSEKQASPFFMNPVNPNINPATGKVLLIPRAPAPGQPASFPVRPASVPGQPVSAPGQSSPEPLQGKLVHITGSLRAKSRIIYSFAVSAGGVRIFDMQESDLQAAGYSWKPLSDCMGYLTYKDKTYSVVCDPPAIGSGTSNAPVVIAGARLSSDRPAPFPPGGAAAPVVVPDPPDFVRPVRRGT